MGKAGGGEGEVGERGTVADKVDDFCRRKFCSQSLNKGHQSVGGLIASCQQGFVPLVLVEPNLHSNCMMMRHSRI